MPYLDFIGWGVLAQGEAPGMFDQIFNSIIPPIVIIGILMYFMLLLPERRQREKLKQQQSSLKKNDKVMIAGGIYGVVVDAPKEGDRVKVRIDEKTGTAVSVLRGSILQVLGDESKPGESKPADKKEAESTSDGK